MKWGTEKKKKRATKTRVDGEVERKNKECLNNEYKRESRRKKRNSRRKRLKDRVGSALRGDAAGTVLGVISHWDWELQHDGWGPAGHGAAPPRLLRPLLSGS